MNTLCGRPIETLYPDTVESAPEPQKPDLSFLEPAPVGVKTLMGRPRRYRDIQFTRPSEWKRMRTFRSALPVTHNPL